MFWEKARFRSIFGGAPGKISEIIWLILTTQIDVLERKYLREALKIAHKGDAGMGGGGAVLVELSFSIL